MTQTAKLKDLTKELLYGLGYYRAYRALRTPAEPRLLVLMYHDILDERRAADPNELDDESPSAAEFESHLRVIRDHYAVMPLGEAADSLRRGELDRNTVAVTFDDGYESVYTVALPLLRRFEVPATVFLLTGWTDNRSPYWWPRLGTLLQHSEFAGVTSGALEIAAGTTCDALGELPPGPPARRRLARQIEHCFRRMTGEERTARLDALERLLYPSSPPPAGPRALSWEQVREMAGSGVDFEPHTRSHIDIGNETFDIVREEIALSARDIEEQVSRKTRGFAYPYGKDIASYRAVEPVLAGLGFSYAVTAANGVNSQRTEPFLLWRMSLPKTTSRGIIHRSLILAFGRGREERPATR